MDAVYMVKEAERNEELRYSLRSLRNAPFIDRVVIVGFCPSWVVGVLHIEVAQDGVNKAANTNRNLAVACADDRLSRDICLMNDDFYIVKRIASIPVQHRGPIQGVIDHYGGTSSYIERMTASLAMLRRFGFEEPLSYELHTPFVMNRTRVLSAFDLAATDGGAPDGLHIRSVYGALHAIGGDLVDDVKLDARTRKWRREWSFLSTNDATFNLARPKLAAYFAQPSPYEAGPHQGDVSTAALVGCERTI